MQNIKDVELNIDEFINIYNGLLIKKIELFIEKID